ncbi:hypothetical protein [uncultured Cellulomonas sp.]|uniref:AMIN-like domain-containing (lipo)protein n=1 Tax=uncultured Cellulomonas sp. TaxID=189682 RepID=UPI0028EE5DEC|nr:hypothetical protein [uncultured Cellulomonas sp.]
MRRRGVVVLFVLLAALVITPAAPSVAGPYCGIRWGSLEKTNGEPSRTGDVFAVRTGRHACYDRVVIDVEGPFAGYVVRYVDTVTMPAGDAVAVRGGARLEVVARAWTQVAASGSPYFLMATSGTVTDMRDVTGYRTLRQVAWAGTSDDGNTTIGVGTRARLPFRAFILPGPHETTSRLVVDVAHRW